MLQHLGETHAAEAVERACETVLESAEVRTPDLGGKASTRDIADAVVREVSVVPAKP